MLAQRLSAFSCAEASASTRTTGSAPTDGRERGRPGKLGVEPLDLREHRPGPTLLATGTFAVACGYRSRTAAASDSFVRQRSRAAAPRRAVSCHVILGVDDVARLLAAEHAALLQCLEHVPVADVGGDDAHATLRHEPVETEIRHLRDRHELDAEVERQHRENRVAVDHLARSSTASIRSPSPSKATPVEPLLTVTSCCKDHGVGGAAADVDVRAVGLVADRDHLAPSSSNAFGAIAE